MAETAIPPMPVSVTARPAAVRFGSALPGWLDPARRGASALLAPYSQILFSRSPVVGLLVLAATFVVPEVGLVGLLGVALATSTATVLGLDRESVRTGVLGYNALLLFLMVGAFLDRSPAFWGLALVLAALVLLVHVSLSSAMRYHFRLPVLSLPFVLVGWVAMAAVPYVKGMAFRPHPAALDLGAFPGPEMADLFLRSLGAIFFQPHWVAGALVLAALLSFSRIATLHAIVGFGVAIFADSFLFTFPEGFVELYIGFNFVMTAVALGGIFYVPGPASMLLAAGGSLACGLVSVGMIRLLQPFGLPVLAMPFCVTVLVTLYALALREAGAAPRPVDFISGSPEENLHHHRTRVERFRSALPVRLQLPFRGAWVCTQGNDGEHTHRGPWRHGLDFEVADRAGARATGTGDELSDWLCYKLPVTAAAAGTVVKVVDGLPDNPVGEVDTANNWGNLVVVHHAPGVFSLVAHLSPGSIAVREGDVVAAGEQLGVVGSSGRAPVPHLHFQIQATPTVGDPTLPVEFAGIVSCDVVDEVLARHLPDEGQRLRNVAVHDGLARALALPPGERLHAKVLCDGVERTEGLISDIDAIGARSLVSPGRDARLWFEGRGDSFVVYDYAGPRDGALFAWYAALARVPLEDCPGLSWHDHLNPRRLGTTALAWLRDAAAALVPPPDQPISYACAHDGDTIVIRGRSPGRRGQRAVRTEARIRPGVGVEWLRVTVAGRPALEVSIP